MKCTCMCICVYIYIRTRTREVFELLMQNYVKRKMSYFDYLHVEIHFQFTRVYILYYIYINYKVDVLNIICNMYTYTRSGHGFYIQNANYHSRQSTHPFPVNELTSS